MAPRALVVAAAALLLAVIPLQRDYGPDLEWYWSISWDHGFVRRGLCGELAGLLPVADLETAARLMTGLSAAVAATTVAVVAVLRIWHGDPVSVALGASLIVGPVGYAMVVSDPRPEYLGFPAVLCVMAACHAWSAGRRGPARCWLGLAGALMGAVTLASENVLFAVLPWCVVLLTATTVAAPLGVRVRLLVGMLAMPTAAAAAVVVGGRADARQLAALREDAGGLDGSPDRLMRYLGQDLGDSVRTVVHAGIGFRLFTMLVAVGIVAVLAGLLLACGAGREWLRLPADRLLRFSLCLPVAALLFQTATGLDWPRWVGQLGSGALLTLTSWGVLVPDPDPAPWSVGRIGRIALFSCLLVLVPAVPFSILHGGVTAFVTSRVS
ncbi:MAG TPA: hypothetical protein VFV89_15405 [Nocardioides sp.]|uniref:hypothetical protein n=1 Tax=Nocardioides sp. TaxID=35761 RepID=UPI002E36FCA1|nr:hypothetical protein [Nocardioides sp.]HEX5089194.1 hypothetical protein [Nocardioides sp.]